MQIMPKDSSEEEQRKAKCNTASDEDSIFADKWKTLYRPLPKAVYDVVKEIEDLVGIEIGNLSSENRSMGQSVAVWSILTHFMNEHIEELKQTAKDWKE
jgi:AAA+ ATPase superfamily predicted ATPase